jgi:hypothetical protein
VISGPLTQFNESAHIKNTQPQISRAFGLHCRYAALA